MKTLILAITASISLTACFPIVERIYQPTAKGGTVLESTCLYDSGTGRWDKIEITQGSITIHVRVEEEQGQLSASIAIFIPEGTTVSFTRTEATISSKESTQQVSIEAVASYDRSAGKITQQEPTSQMVGRNEPTGNQRYQRAGAGKKQFATTVKLPNHHIGQSFTLDFPPLQTGSGYISVQPIHFYPNINARVGGLCP
jgi:hypothetical protein